MSDRVDKAFSDEDARWIHLLWFLLKSSSYKRTKEKWKEFVEQIKHQGRFFSRPAFLDEVDQILEENRTVCPAGTIMYRARRTTLDKTPLSNIERAYKQALDRGLLPESDYLDGLPWQDALTVRLSVGSASMEEFMRDCDRLMDASVPFLGLPESDCDAPPSEKAVPGRANPEGIAYLYAADTPETAVMEVRPSLNEIVSVAEIEALRPLVLFDWCKPRNETERQPERTKSDLDCEYLSEFFSQLNPGNSLDYIPTQYLSEYIKSKGFDGMRFQSSVCNGGVNIVLFDTAEETCGYRITASKTVYIESTSIVFSDLGLWHIQHMIDWNSLSQEVEDSLES